LPQTLNLQSPSAESTRHFDARLTAISTRDVGGGQPGAMTDGYDTK